MDIVIIPVASISVEIAGDRIFPLTHLVEPIMTVFIRTTVSQAVPESKRGSSATGSLVHVADRSIVEATTINRQVVEHSDIITAPNLIEPAVFADVL